MPNVLNYTIQRVGAEKTEAAAKVLKNMLKEVESKEHTMEQHQLMTLLKRELERK